MKRKEKLNSIFWDNVRILRDGKKYKDKLSNNEVAEALGISSGSYREQLSKNKGMSLERLVQYSQGLKKLRPKLNVDIAMLLSDSDPYDYQKTKSKNYVENPEIVEEVFWNNVQKQLDKQDNPKIYKDNDKFVVNHSDSVNNYNMNTTVTLYKLESIAEALDVEPETLLEK